MSIGISIFLIAVGAILHFAVSARVSGVSIGTVGVILMIAGALGLVIAVVMLGMSRSSGARTTVVEEDRRY